LTVEEAEQTAYLAQSLETCISEVSHHLGGTVRLRNRFSIEFDVEVERVVDLTTTKELKRLKIGMQDLIDDQDYSLTQEIARRLRRGKVQALIVPSARDPQGKNVVLFLENIDRRKAIRKIFERKIE